MPDLFDPRVTALLLYFQGDVQKIGKQQPYIAFEEKAGEGIRSETPSADCRRSTWQFASGESAQLDWILAHDTHLLRVSLSFPGMQPPEIWSVMNANLENILTAVQSTPSQPEPWAATRIYYARTTRGARTDDLSAIIAQLAGSIPGVEQPLQVEPTPYGWSWPLGSGTSALAESRQLYQRRQAWIVPQERAARVDDVFLQPLNQGLTRVELYLHKSLHLARQHESIRSDLETARIELQDSMLISLRSVDFEKVHYAQPGMEQISRKLLVFLAGKAQMEVLLNSLRSNNQSYLEHLERVKLETPSHAVHSALIKRSIEQLESDLANAQAISDSSYAFQDIQRSVESNRLERAGMLLGGAATILAGLAIYDNFLDIWNLSVEKSGLLLPSPVLRVILGALAAVFWPLGAYQLVTRKWWRGGISLFIGVLAIILAIVFTVLINS